MAGELVAELSRRGDAPLLVLLTDGRANVSRDGIGGRARAEQEAFAAAAELGQQRLPGLLVDIAPHPQERARLLAQTMGAEYLALPTANAERLSAAVQARMPSQSGGRRA
jgi:magnesium chelatase subunit D